MAIFVKNLFIYTILLFLLPLRLPAQEKIEITYEPTDAILINPERGFHILTDWRPGYAALNLQHMLDLREEKSSLVMRIYTLSSWKDSPLPQSLLDLMHQDFNTMRNAGVKAVLRFRYAVNIGESDAPLAIILGHLDQLKPVLEEHYDVIAVMDAGFIGAWGEWHSSTNNLDNTASRREVLFKILEVLPEHRFVNVRTPSYKMFIFNNFTALPDDEAYTGTYRARTGHHNDGFLASHNDLGTYGNPEYEKNYLNQENKFVPMGGETGGVSDGEFYKCENALNELALLRWSHLHSGWYGPTLQSWIDDGCMPEVEKRLGYRFVLQNGSYTSEVAPGNLFSFELNLENEGWASPFNARGFSVLLRSLTNPARIYKVQPPEDPRFWHSGLPVQIVHQIGIPSDMPEDRYELLIHFPDPVPELYHRPEYAIRTANEGIWEDETGYNSLGHIVKVASDVPGESYTEGLIFRPDRTTTGLNLEEVSVSRDFALLQNYPNPFNPSTVIPFELQEPAHIRLEVFNKAGQRVSVIADKFMSAGSHVAMFNAGGLAAGMYLYTLRTGSYTGFGKMLLVK
jgi:hypothetical protein